jgi:hypothetical protein
MQPTMNAIVLVMALLLAPSLALYPRAEAGPNTKAPAVSVPASAPATPHPVPRSWVGWPNASA